MPLLPVIPPGPFAMVAIAFVTAGMSLLAGISWLNHFFPRLRLVPLNEMGFRRGAYTMIALIGVSANLFEGHFFLMVHAFVWQLIMLALLIVVRIIAWVILRSSIRHLPQQKHQ